MSEKIPIDKIVDFAAGRLSREESLALLDQIEHDPQASQDLDLIASMMEIIDKDGKELFKSRPEVFSSFFSRLKAIISSAALKLRSHPVLSGAVAFAAVFVALMLMLPPSSPYGNLASLNDFDLGATVRGVGLEEFNVGFDLYHRGNYEESIRLFERYIRAFPKSRLVEYAHYSAGAAYLRWSEWRFFSLFVGFNQARVHQGMWHLHQVVQSSRNSRLLEDAHWLLAKGELMLADMQGAADELRIVVGMKGSRHDEADELLRTLLSLHTSR
jgi:tetratricopeptide (TPR) repeat protein